MMCIHGEFSGMGMPSLCVHLDFLLEPCKSKSNGRLTKTSICITILVYACQCIHEDRKQEDLGQKGNGRRRNFILNCKIKPKCNVRLEVANFPVYVIALVMRFSLF